MHQLKLNSAVLSLVSESFRIQKTMCKAIWNHYLETWTLLVLAGVKKEQNLFLQLPNRK